MHIEPCFELHHVFLILRINSHRPEIDSLLLIITHVNMSNPSLLIGVLQLLKIIGELLGNLYRLSQNCVAYLEKESFTL